MLIKIRYPGTATVIISRFKLEELLMKLRTPCNNKHLNQEKYPFFFSTCDSCDKKRFRRLTDIPAGTKEKELRVNSIDDPVEMQNLRS